METNGETEKSLESLEGNLREAACFGDERAVKIFVEGGVNVNAKHEINGWTPLHWAAKRGHLGIVNYLLANGADKSISSLKGEKPEDLTESESIREALGLSTGVAKEDTSATPEKPKKLPIIPNYIANPVLSYKVDTMGLNHTEKNPENPFKSPAKRVSFSTDKDMVLKIRVADLPMESDFIEIEVTPYPELSFTGLLQSCCKELKIDSKKVVKVRKLPNTLVRNDRDISRLRQYQEIEFVMNYIQPQVQLWQNQANNHLLSHQRQVIPSSSGVNHVQSRQHGDNLMEKSAYCRNGTLLY